jgi:hypothetical protein
MYYEPDLFRFFFFNLFSSQLPNLKATIQNHESTNLDHQTRRLDELNTNLLTLDKFLQQEQC